MRCRDAGLAIVERGAGRLAPDAEAALREHLTGCPQCAAQSALEERLRDGMSLLREDYPFEIDVRPRVLSRIAEIGRINRDEVPSWQLGWAAGLAVACFLGLLGGAWMLWIDAAPGLRQGIEALPALAGALGKLAAPILALVSLPFKLLGIGLKVLGALGTVLAELESVGVAGIALCYAMMGVTITLVLGRDFRRPLPALLREDR